MASLVVPHLAFLFFFTLLLHQTHSCGRKSPAPSSDTCNISPTLWDATYRSCHDELLVKRDVSDITGNDKFVDGPVNKDAEEINGLYFSITGHHNRVKRQDLPRYVYRVIRSDENPEQGLTAKNPSATYQPTFHVCRGSTYATQYISTTESEDVAATYAARTNNRYVRINLRVAMNAGVQVLDVRDGNNVNGVTATNFARASRELLLSGAAIPRNAITLMYNPSC